MNVAWQSPALGAGMNPHGLHFGLTVSLIMTARDQLMTCSSDEALVSVVARNANTRFSFIPVAEGDRFLGLLHAEEWFDKDAPDGRVVDHYQRLAEETLIGANASILDFVCLADRHPCRLVVSGSRIAGLVSLSDLQRLPVRAALFALITGLELAMIDLIRVRLPQAEEWIDLLSQKRRDKIREESQRSRRAEGYVDDLLFTQFCDKADIIRKAIDLGVPRARLRDDFFSFQRLRNDLAHANDYASTPQAAAGVAKTVRRLVDMQLLLESATRTPLGRLAL